MAGANYGGENEMAYSGLDTYLNDHIAGATAGRNLAKMAAQEHQTDEHGPVFSEIYAAIQADFDTLQELASALGVEASASKSALASSCLDLLALLASAISQREKIEEQRQKVAALALKHTVSA